MLHQSLMRMSLGEPVLMEVTPALEHVQRPDEGAVEQWVALEGGTFEAYTEPDDPYLIYVRSTARAKPGIAKKKKRATKSLLVARPFTRSQARPRVRVQASRMLF